MAPPRKPVALKKLTGTLRPSREPKRAPTPRRGRPRPPKSLTATARMYWSDLVKLLDSMRVMTVGDVTALTLLCEALGEWRAADDIVRAEGVVYESTTRSGIMKRPHPAVAIRADAWRRVEKMLGKFGLTPSDRSRVETARHALPGGRDPWDEIAHTSRFLFGDDDPADSYMRRA